MVFRDANSSKRKVPNAGGPNPGAWAFKAIEKCMD